MRDQFNLVMSGLNAVPKVPVSLGEITKHRSYSTVILVYVVIVPKFSVKQLFIIYVAFF